MSYYYQKFTTNFDVSEKEAKYIIRLSNCLDSIVYNLETDASDEQARINELNRIKNEIPLNTAIANCPSDIIDDAISLAKYIDNCYYPGNFSVNVSTPEFKYRILVTANGEYCDVIATAEVIRTMLHKFNNPNPVSITYAVLSDREGDYGGGAIVITKDEIITKDAHQFKDEIMQNLTSQTQISDKADELEMRLKDCLSSLAQSVTSDEVSAELAQIHNDTLAELNKLQEMVGNKPSLCIDIFDGKVKKISSNYPEELGQVFVHDVRTNEITNFTNKIYQDDLRELIEWGLTHK